MSIDTASTDETEWTHADSFSDITADLVSEQQFEGFIAGLFATAPGTWVNVATLCEGMPSITQQIMVFQHALDTDPEVDGSLQLYATWLPHPENDDYVLIYYFLEADFLTNTAIYNKRWFLKKHPQLPSM